MNKNKVEKYLNALSEEMSKDMPTNKEYLTILANMLFSFVIPHISRSKDLNGLNIYDANSIEKYAMLYPEDVILQLGLQAHVILKLAEIGFPEWDNGKNNV